MDQSENFGDPHGSLHSVKDTASGKKPYVKPAFDWERAFETMALSCGKVNSSQAQCRTNKKNS